MQISGICVIIYKKINTKGLLGMNRLIAVYCRVSTESENQLNSLSNQKQMFLERIEHDKDSLYDIFADEGLTGTKLNNRKEFNRMLELAGLDIIETIAEKRLANGNLDRRVKRKTTNFVLSDREPLFNYIYVKNTSRFARNTLSYDIVCKLRQKNVHIFFLEQNIDTSTYTQDLLLQLWQVFDANDSRDKSAKVLSGLEQSAKNNVIHTNKLIFGYEYDERDNSLKQIPHEAEIIRFIFESYSQGFGIRQIINRCNEMGYKTRKGKEFSKTTINRLLQNEKFCGLNQQLKWTSGIVFAKESYPKIRDDYSCIKNERIDAIISEELFYKCKALRESKHHHSVNIGVYNGISKYAGKIFCVHCHDVFISDKDKNKDSVREFYRCKTKKFRGVSVCKSRNVKKSELDEKILQDIDAKRLELCYTNTIKLLEQHLSHIDDIYSSDNEVLVSDIKKQIDSLKDEIKITFREYTRKKLSEDIYEEIVSEDNAKIEELQKKLDILEAPLLERDRQRDLLKIRIEKLKKRLLSPFTENDYLDCVKITITDKRIITEYSIREFQFEMSETLKSINLKRELGNVF